MRLFLYRFSISSALVLPLQRQAIVVEGLLRERRMERRECSLAVFKFKLCDLLVLM